MKNNTLQQQIVVPVDLLAGGVSSLGFVEAGFPAPAEESDADKLTLDEWLVGDRRATFMLTIRSNAYASAGINNGDYILMERAREPKNGDLVVVAGSESWIIARYTKKSKTSQPQLESLSDYSIDESLQGLISGVVSSCIRKYE